MASYFEKFRNTLLEAVQINNCASRGILCNASEENDICFCVESVDIMMQEILKENDRIVENQAKAGNLRLIRNLPKLSDKKTLPEDSD